MKIVKILGGLGNQMFQYALYISLKHKCNGETVKIDTSCFRGYPLHNGYELERVFNVKPEHANWYDLLRLAYPYCHYRMWQIGKRLLPKRHTMHTEKDNEEYDASVLNVTSDCYYDGYWQNEKYFIEVKEQLYEIFTPKVIDARNASFAKELSSCNSVSLHVRRGDYTKNPLYGGICDETYYINAIKKIQSYIDVDVYCVFSNDIVWCKEKLPKIIGNKAIRYVDWNTGTNSYMDMYLMSHCRHNIIANSSFSWWGAWLNRSKDQIVISPKKWNNIKGSKFEIPEKWQRL